MIRAPNNLERRIYSAGIARFIWLAGDYVITISDLLSFNIG
jgi:hypothetical protein